MTPKQQLFIDEYLKTWNATQAAINAGYSERSAAEIGYENLRKPHIAEAIEKHLKASAMSRDEVLMRLARHARADLSDFLTFVEGVRNPIIDLSKAREAGVLDVLKKLQYDDDGHIKIELHDVQAALDKLAKAYGLYSDENTVSGEITIKVVRDDDDHNSPA